MRGVRRTPYRECLTLLGWAEITWTDLRGRALRDGIPHLGGLTAADMVGTLVSYLIDDTVSGFIPRAEARDIVDAHLRGSTPTPTGGETSAAWAAPTPSGRAAPNRDTWGLEPDHIAGLERAMALAGGG